MDFIERLLSESRNEGDLVVDTKQCQFWNNAFFHQGSPQDRSLPSKFQREPHKDKPTFDLQVFEKFCWDQVFGTNEKKLPDVKILN